EYPVKLASGLERLQDGQDMTQQARDEIERLEAAQTEAGQVAAVLLDVASNPEHPLFWSMFGACPIKSTLRMSRNGLLLRLIYVEGLADCALTDSVRPDWPNVRDAMASLGHRTTMRNIKRWYRQALRDLAILEKQFHLQPEWSGDTEQEGGGTE
ncbi:MAG: hypothetical protein IJT94_01795, partial [Oscillibacter sp.]|nr:hypothetical protein [Oscillibacter sp.]